MLLILFIISCKPKPEPDYLFGVSVGNGSLNASFNLDYELTFPVNLSDSQINWSLLNVNFTRFMLQDYTDHNISAYGQSNDTPCYVLTNNGTENITVRVKVSATNTSYPVYLVAGNNNISGSPKITLTTSFQEFTNLSMNLTRVVNETNILLINNTPSSLDNNIIKPGSIALYNTTSGEVISSINYTVDYGVGTVTYLGAKYNNTNVSGNYTYRSWGETINVSCFGDYVNVTLNSTFDFNITWNLTVI